MLKLFIIFIGCVVINGFPQDSNLQKVGRIYKGPNSLVIIEGPDGSVIKADLSGGSVAVGESVPPLAVIPTLNVSTTDSGPTVEPSGETAETTETTESNKEDTTISTGDLTTLSEEPASDVEIIEPVTTPLQVPAVEDVELNGPSVRIAISGSKVIVAGPSSVLVKEGKQEVKHQQSTKDTAMKQHSDQQVFKKEIVAVRPGVYGGLVGHPEWANLVATGFPIGFNPIYF